MFKFPTYSACSGKWLEFYKRKATFFYKEKTQESKRDSMLQWLWIIKDCVLSRQRKVKRNLFNQVSPGKHNQFVSRSP